MYLQQNTDEKLYSCSKMTQRFMLSAYIWTKDGTKAPPDWTVKSIVTPFSSLSHLSSVIFGRPFQKSEIIFTIQFPTCCRRWSSKCQFYSQLIRTINSITPSPAEKIPLICWPEASSKQKNKNKNKIKAEKQEIFNTSNTQPGPQTLITQRPWCRPTLWPTPFVLVVCEVDWDGGLTGDCACFNPIIIPE